MKKTLLVLFLFLISIQNSEAQWFTQQSGTTNPLYDIEFINEQTGWCSGVGVILKTTNGGVHWIDFLNDAPSKPYSAIFPVDTNVVYAVGYFRTFIKSTNGGVNWTIIENGNTGEGDYYSLFFLNQNTGWAGVNYANGIRGVRYTTDGGTNFIIGQTGIPQDLYFKDSLNGIGVGGLSYIYKTTDGGLNWNSFSLVFTGDFYRVSFINDYTGYTASKRAVYKTTNFGSDWDSVGNIPVSLGSVLSVEFCNENTGWAGTQYQIFKTTNGGRDWFSQIGTGVIYNITSFNDSLVWACGNGGRIWHTMNGGTSNLNNISNSIPSIFKLYQNYPNPFNPTTNIKFDLPKDVQVSVKIYDMVGREIKTLANEFKTAGRYSVTFSGADLASGVYYYKIKAGEFEQVRKMILLK